MGTERIRMLQLARKGYYCSQILVIMGLEMKGEHNPDLVRAMDGLARGCIEGSCTCGSLTGGCCLLALFAGRGTDKEKREIKYKEMMEELVHWFWQKYGFKYGGVDCMAIRGAEAGEQEYQRYWQILEDVYFKVSSILGANGIAMSYRGCYAS
jgi:hypothetical protein